jgi:hypothetical protein
MPNGKRHPTWPRKWTDRVGLRGDAGPAPGRVPLNPHVVTSLESWLVTGPQMSLVDRYGQVSVILPFHHYPYEKAMFGVY